MSEDAKRTYSGFDIPLHNGPSSGEEVAGSPPYSRGVHETMYRGRLWTMRQYAGFSSASETNARFLSLLEKGQSGLSVAFDLPTQLGLDSDDPMAIVEVGKVGVAIDSVEDMHLLLKGIDTGKVSTSMTINSPASILLAMYFVASEENGVDVNLLRGTIQNDILKEYIARGTYVFPPRASMRLITDIMSWCSSNLPTWNTISISGYHIREAGATATQELAFTLSNALAYVEAAVDAGLDIDQFAPRLSFFFGCHNDLFEEVAKFRAARRLWHDLISERFEPKNPKSKMLRFHTQTAGVTLTAQQPLNNIVRVSYQALSAVLGGTQSLHTNSYDEALGLPTDESATLALRTQQVLAHETGVADVVDPLGGSWYVESLTDRIYDEAKRLIDTIDEKGGALRAIETGFQQRLLHESAWKEQVETDANRRLVIGVNHAIREESGGSNAGQKLDPTIGEKQIEAISKLKTSRDQGAAEQALQRLRETAASDGNLMEAIVEATRCRCTIGEMMEAMKKEFGTWMAPSGV